MRYEAPDSLEGAVALLAGAQGEARVLAGGTDLLVQMRADILDPDLIVDIKKIAETRAVTEEKGGWRIGAAVTGAELKEHARAQEGLARRGRGRQPDRLDPGAGPRHPGRQPLQRLAGRGQRARAHRGGGGGHPGRAQGPARPPGRGRHARAPASWRSTKGEIVASFLLPPRPARSSDAYLRFIPRTEMDIAVVGAGVSLTVDGAGIVTAARVSLGAVAARVLLVPEAAQAIVGSRLDAAAQERLEAAARAACRPIDDKRGTIEFRIKVAGVLARRAALIALDRARSELMAKHHIEATVNGDAVEFLCETEETLLDVLRDTLDLTGSKEGCSSGDCGACSVTARRPPGLLVPGAGLRGRRAARSRPSRAWPRASRCIRCSSKFLEQRRAPVRHLHPGRPGGRQGPARAVARTRPRPRCATGWPATSAGAPATTRS